MANPTLAEWNSLVAKIRERCYASGHSDFSNPLTSISLAYYYPNLPVFDVSARPMQDMQSFRFIERLQYWVATLFNNAEIMGGFTLPISYPVVKVGAIIVGSRCTMASDTFPGWNNNPTSFHGFSYVDHLDEFGNEIYGWHPATYTYEHVAQARIDAGLSDYMNKPDIPDVPYPTFDVHFYSAFRRITPRCVAFFNGNGAAQPATHDTEGNEIQTGHRAWEVVIGPWPGFPSPPPVDVTPFRHTGKLMEKTATGWIHCGQVNGQMVDVLDTENDRPFYAGMGMLRGGDYLAFREYYDELLALITLVQRFAGYAGTFFADTTFDPVLGSAKSGGSSTSHPDDEDWATVKASSETNYAAAVAVNSTARPEKFARGYRSRGVLLPPVFPPGWVEGDPSPPDVYAPDVFIAGASAKTNAVGYQLPENELEIVKTIKLLWVPITIFRSWVMGAEDEAAYDAQELEVCQIQEFNAHGGGFAKDNWNLAGTIVSAEQGSFVHGPVIGDLGTPDHNGAPPAYIPPCTTTERYSGYEGYITAVEITPQFTT